VAHSRLLFRHQTQTECWVLRRKTMSKKAKKEELEKEEKPNLSLDFPWAA